MSEAGSTRGEEATHLKRESWEECWSDGETGGKVQVILAIACVDLY